MIPNCRIRTERRPADLSPRHFLPEHRDKASSPIEDRASSWAEKTPFCFLTRGLGSMSGVIIEQLSADDSIRMMEEATLVLHDREVAGEVLISESTLYFVEQKRLEDTSGGGRQEVRI